MMNIVFTQTAWNDYLYWHTQDRRTIQKINRLIKSIDSFGPLGGEGKPEVLKYINAYSRRIDDRNRLIYQITKTDIIIISCQGHYDD